MLSLAEQASPPHPRRARAGAARALATIVALAMLASGAAGCHLFARFASNDAAAKTDAAAADTLGERDAGVDAAVDAASDAGDAGDASGDSRPADVAPPDAPATDGAPCKTNWSSTVVAQGQWEGVAVNALQSHFIVAGRVGSALAIQRYGVCGQIGPVRQRTPAGHTAAWAYDVFADTGQYCAVGSARTSASGTVGYGACWRLSNGVLAPIPFVERTESNITELRHIASTGAAGFIAATAVNGWGTLLSSPAVIVSRPYGVPVDGQAHKARAVSFIAGNVWMAGHTTNGVYMAAYDMTCVDAATCTRRHFLTYASNLLPSGLVATRANLHLLGSDRVTGRPTLMPFPVIVPNGSGTTIEIDSRKGIARRAVFIDPTLYIVGSLEVSGVTRPALFIADSAGTQFKARLVGTSGELYDINYSTRTNVLILVGWRDTAGTQTPTVTICSPANCGTLAPSPAP